MSECPTFEELSAFADRELAPADWPRLRLHTGACSSCAQTMQGMLACKRAVTRSRLPPSVWPHLSRAIRTTFAEAMGDECRRLEAYRVCVQRQGELLVEQVESRGWRAAVSPRRRSEER